MIGAVSELTWRLLPDIRAHEQGRIINVASVAGLIPGAAGQTLYAPVKSFMIRLSESLSLENADRGVRVTALCPGFTWSEFHDVTGSRAIMNRLPKWVWLSAEEVARAGVEAAERGRVVVVPGLFYKLVCGLVRLLPSALLLQLMRRNSRKFRRAE
jgi:short-subunit dehydrogenase